MRAPLAKARPRSRVRSRLLWAPIVNSWCRRLRAEVTIWTQANHMLQVGGIRSDLRSVSGPMTCNYFSRVMMPAIAAAVMMTAVNTASAQEAEPSQPGFLDQLFGGSDRLGN